MSNDDELIAFLNRAAEYTVPELPEPGPSADELLAQRKVSFARKARAAAARKLIPIQIHIDGPIGIAHFGDPHVDDDGTNIDMLERHVGLVNTTPGLFAANVGDYRNNWVGRLARLFGEQSTSARDALTLAEWLLKAWVVSESCVGSPLQSGSACLTVSP